MNPNPWFSVKKDAAVDKMVNWWVEHMFVNGIPAKTFFRRNHGYQKRFTKALEEVFKELMPNAPDPDYFLSLFCGQNQPPHHITRAVRQSELKNVTWMLQSAMFVYGDAENAFRIVCRSRIATEERL